jgi:hypothetical protein
MNSTCECGASLQGQETQKHLVSKEHRHYVNMKKTFQEALTRPVKPGVAS